MTLRFQDGSTFHFPRRSPEPLKYPGGETDPNDRLATTETFDAVASLTYARYQMGLYLNEKVKPRDADELQLVTDLQTAISAAAGFIRTTALKRLSSSAHAFILTIKRMIARNAVLDYAVTNGLNIPLGNFSEQFFQLDSDVDADQGDGVEDLSDAASPAWGVGWSDEQWLSYAAGAYSSLAAKRPKGIKWARPGLFNVTELLKNVRSDSATLQEILDTNGVWSPDEDTKLRALAQLIQDVPSSEKVLVFSEYKDTVDYLAQHLPRWTDRSIGAASGASGDPVRLARRFSPHANKHLGGLPAGEEEIDVLLTTDVLSEGQNLQDAAIVVNWDLPWTIIKVIQRAGRVDRVGQKAETIRVMSFLPQAGVEGVIQLRARLLQRLRNSEQIFGGGERFFDDDDFTTDITGLFDGSANLGEDEGDVDPSSYALGIWEAAADADRRIALDLQEVVYSTKAAPADVAAHVITYGRTDAGTDLLVRSTDDVVKFLTPIEALAATESAPAEGAAPVLNDHHEHVERAAAAMTEQIEENTVLLNHGLRKRLFDYLLRQGSRIDLPSLTLARLSQLVDALAANPLRESAKAEVNGILRSARLIGDDGGQLERLLALHDDHNLIDVRDLGADRVQLITSMGFNPNASGRGWGQE